MFIIFAVKPFANLQNCILKTVLLILWNSESLFGFLSQINFKLVKKKTGREGNYYLTLYPNVNISSKLFPFNELITTCVCVCLYSSIVKASSETCLRGTDQRSCVVNMYLGASAKFLHLYFRIYLISPPKT